MYQTHFLFLFESGSDTTYMRIMLWGTLTQFNTAVLFGANLPVNWTCCLWCFQVKLSDFGMARVLDDNSDVYNLSNMATRIPIAWSVV